MHISKLLEGTIKVPDVVFNQAMAYVSSHLFSAMLTYLHSDEGDEYYDNVSYIKKMVRTAKQKYGDFSVGRIDYDVTSEHTVVLKGSQVDQRYLKNNPRFARRSVEIHLSVLSETNDSEPMHGLYYPRTNNTDATIVVYILSTAKIKKLARSPEYIDSVLIELEGIVEHELSHAIQQLGLNDLKPNYKLTDNNQVSDRDEYLIDKYEFSPMIISHAKEFLRALSHFKASGVNITKDKIRELFNAFVNPTAPHPKWVEMETPDFFEVLYRKDRNKWKVAVKYLYSKVSDML